MVIIGCKNNKMVISLNFICCIEWEIPNYCFKIACPGDFLPFISWSILIVYLLSLGLPWGLPLSYTSKEKICGGESGIFPLSGEIPPPRGSLSLCGQGPPVHCIGGWGVYRNIIRQEVDSLPKGSPIPMEFRFKPNVGLKSAFHWSESSAMHAWLSSNTQNQFD